MASFDEVMNAMGGSFVVGGAAIVHAMASLLRKDRMRRRAQGVKKHAAAVPRSNCAPSRNGNDNEKGLDGYNVGLQCMIRALRRGEREQLKGEQT